MALPRPAGKPIPPLKVLGSLEKAGQQRVFLSSGQEVYVVKHGDRFADGLYVRELTKEQIVISRGNQDKGVTLALKEERAPQRNTRSFSPRPTAAPRPTATPRPFVPSRNSLNLNTPATIERPVKVGEENRVDP